MEGGAGHPSSSCGIARTLPALAPVPGACPPAPPPAHLPLPCPPAPPPARLPLPSPPAPTPAHRVPAIKGAAFPESFHALTPRLGFRVTLREPSSGPGQQMIHPEGQGVHPLHSPEKGLALAWLLGGTLRAPGVSETASPERTVGCWLSGGRQQPQGASHRASVLGFLFTRAQGLNAAPQVVGRPPSEKAGLVGRREGPRGWIESWADGCVDAGREGWGVDGWMDGRAWIDGWVERCMYIVEHR